MNKLRNILHSKWLYLFLFFLLLCSFLKSFLFSKSKYSGVETELIGTIDAIYQDGDYLELTIRAKEKIIAFYTYQTKEEKSMASYKIGYQVKLTGTMKQPSEKTNPFLFDYKNYLKEQDINWTFQIASLQIINKKQSFLAKIESNLERQFQKREKTKPYLYAFLLGNTRYLDNEIKEQYTLLGIRHLFAISGMHLSFFIFLYEKLTSQKRNAFFLSFFLLFYLLLLHFKVSAFFSIVFFLLNQITKKLKVSLSLQKRFFLTTFLLIFPNPKLITSFSFIYSFLLHLALLFFFSNSKQKTTLQSLFSLSFFSFLITLPLNLLLSSYINIGSPFYNLLFVPLVTYLLFPCAFLSIFFPILDTVLYLFVQILEGLTSMCILIPSGFYFIKPNLLLVIIYFVLLFLGYHNKKAMLYFFLLLVIHKTYPTLIQSDYLLMLDVGQGDCFLLHSGDKNILIDTGGTYSYEKEEWQKRKSSKTLAEKTIIPILHALGISKLDLLVLTHGDMDHMGEAIKLVENIKIKKVLLNSNTYNELEKTLIKKLEDFDIPYEQSKRGRYERFHHIQMLSLETPKQEENESSIILYIQIKNYQLLFMGDSNLENEKEILNYYKIENIDILKVGHHGSNTSSSMEFLNQISPKISLISAGRNNKYHHPNQEVLNRLQKIDSKVYVTSIKGAVFCFFKKNITISSVLT